MFELLRKGLSKDRFRKRRRGKDYGEEASGKFAQISPRVVAHFGAKRA